MYIYGFHNLKHLLQNLHTNNTTIEKVYLLQGRKDSRSKEIVQLLQDNAIPYDTCPRAKLDHLTNFSTHQGFVAEVNETIVNENEENLTDIEINYAKNNNNNETDLHDLVKALGQNTFLLILDSVKDPHNLGACLRTANAFGVNGVVIPKDNAVGVTDTVRKVACGAVGETPVFIVSNLARTLRMLQDEGVWIYGLALEGAKNIQSTKFFLPLAMVMGAEDRGLRKLTRDLCDHLVYIPMFGTVESLNVSVATGITLHEVVRHLTD